MEQSTNDWVISGDGESYYYTNCCTKEAVITEGLCQYRQALRGHDTDCFAPGAVPLDQAVFYIGTQTRFVPTVDPSMVIEQIQCEAYDFAGEWAEDYLDDVRKEDLAALGNLLQSALDKWIEKHGYEPGFFMVCDAREVHVSDYREQIEWLCGVPKSDGTDAERLSR